MPIHPKYFVFVFICGVILSIALSLFVFFGDLSDNDADTLRKYQLEKFEKAKDTVEVIILGDSSSGNAINAKAFSRLSGRPTLNLSLVMTYGLASDYNLLRYVAREGKKLKIVIFLHSLDMWRLGFSQEAYFETLRYSGFPEKDQAIFPSRLRYFEYAVNVKATARSFVDFLSGKKAPLSIDDTDDYPPQSSEKYSNGLKNMEPDRKLSSELNLESVTLFRLLDMACLKEKLICIYAHGPLPDTIFKNSVDTIERVNRTLLLARSIVPITNVLHFSDERFGDNPDHIDSAYKESLTRQYWEDIERALISRGVDSALLP